MTAQVTKMANGRSNSTPLATGYRRVIRRRTLAKWANIHLETVCVSIQDVTDLHDSGIAAKLLSVLSGRKIAVPIFQPHRKKRQVVGWRNICSFLESLEFPEEITGKKKQRILLVAWQRDETEISKHHSDSIGKHSLEIIPLIILWPILFKRPNTISCMYVTGVLQNV